MEISERLQDRFTHALHLQGLDPPLIALAGRQATPRSSQAHHHRSGQLLGLLDGAISVRTDRGLWVLPPTRAAWIPPSYLHAARSHGPFDGWSVYVSLEACAGLPLQPRVIEVSALLRESILRAASWRFGPLHGSEPHIAAIILDEIANSVEDRFGLPMPRDARLLRVADALVTDPADARTLAQWADWAHLSARTLSRRFVDETGMSFSDWRQRARMCRALELLVADMPVTAVALALGYDSTSAFIALFRRTFGTTPGRYLNRVAPAAPPAPD